MIESSWLKSCRSCFMQKFLQCRSDSSTHETLVIFFTAAFGNNHKLLSCTPSVLCALMNGCAEKSQESYQGFRLFKVNIKSRWVNKARRYNCSNFGDFCCPRSWSDKELHLALAGPHQTAATQCKNDSNQQQDPQSLAQMCMAALCRVVAQRVNGGSDRQTASGVAAIPYSAIMMDNLFFSNVCFPCVKMDYILCW